MRSSDQGSDSTAAAGGRHAGAYRLHIQRKRAGDRPARRECCLHPTARGLPPPEHARGSRTVVLTAPGSGRFDRWRAAGWPAPG